ncbi:hypothetical protein P879_10217 [Paragonimus westermani]|uniref:Uncharacterized protein n=1 Tax=Paragonimus westermani TaxID=34504 RepID=A0A8T0D156_9TREM|nr:hypothetical protein P879_10217 [Paragonimus westermani]
MTRSPPAPRGTFSVFANPSIDNTAQVKLYEIRQQLIEAYRVARSAATRISLKRALAQMSELDIQTDAMVSQPHKAGSLPAENIEELPETCPEYWSDPKSDRVYFENVYKTQPCERIPLDKLVELLLYAETCEQATYLIKRIREVYPKLGIRLALRNTTDRAGPCGPWRSVEVFTGANDEAATWLRLAAASRTKYILVGRNMVDMTHYTDVDRMLRVMNNLSVDVVGGAVRLEPEGRWYSGCYQSIVRNFTIRLHPGHDMSAQSCAYCDYIASPFLVRRDVFQQGMADSSMSGPIPFVHFFLGGLHNIDSNRVLTTVACVDVLFHVAGASSWRGQGLAETPKSSWLPLARKWSINRIMLPGPVDYRWTCEEAGINCADFKRAGLIMPGCCLEELANCVKGFLTLAAEHNVSAFLVSGTNLGAVKTYGGFLPWERDADICWDGHKHAVVSGPIKTALHERYRCELGPIKLETKYGLDIEACSKVTNNSCVYFPLHSANWRIELYGEPILVSERLWGLKRPTLIAINGIWATTVPNPGLALRHQYGDNILGHGSWLQHWVESIHKRGNGPIPYLSGWHDPSFLSFRKLFASRKYSVSRLSFLTPVRWDRGTVCVCFCLRDATHNFKNCMLSGFGFATCMKYLMFVVS